MVEFPIWNENWPMTSFVSFMMIYGFLVPCSALLCVMAALDFFNRRADGIVTVLRIASVGIFFYLALWINAVQMRSL